jgi:hypothetical protein
MYLEAGSLPLENPPLKLPLKNVHESFHEKYKASFCSDDLRDLDDSIGYPDP